MGCKMGCIKAGSLFNRKIRVAINISGHKNCSNVAFFEVSY